MTPSNRMAGMIAGALGITTAGLTVAGVLRSRRRNTGETMDRYANEPLGLLEPDRVHAIVTDDGVPLSVEEVDPLDGGPPELTVVLIHGFAVSRRSWHFQRRDLAALTHPRVRQILYDQRGHGRSGPPIGDSCTLETLGKDLDAVLRALAPEGPLVLIGHSMGGMTIMALAEQRPELFAERVRGVALLATSAGELGKHGIPRPLLAPHNPLTAGISEVASWQPGLVEWIRSSSDGITRQIARTLGFGDSDAPPSLINFTVQMLGVTPIQVLTDFLLTLRTHERLAALAALSKCEVLILTGDRDRLTPYSHAQRMAAQLPKATMVRVPGAGHMVILEREDLVTQELAALMQRCATTKPKQRKRQEKQ